MVRRNRRKNKGGKRTSLQNRLLSLRRLPQDNNTRSKNQVITPTIQPITADELGNTLEESILTPNGHTSGREKNSEKDINDSPTTQHSQSERRRSSGKKDKTTLQTKML